MEKTDGSKERRTETINEDDCRENGEELDDSYPTCGHQCDCVSLKTEGMHECRAVV